MKIKSNEFKLRFLMILAMATWGLSWSNAKILGQYADAPILMFWRFLLATITFAPVVLWKKNSFYFNQHSLKYIIPNAVFMVSYNYYYFKGTQIGFAGSGGVLVTTLNPILTALFSYLFFGGLLLKKDIISFILGLSGACIIIRLWDIDISLLFQTGNIYFILASFSWVLVTIITSKSKYIIPFITYSFWSFSFSALFSFTLVFNENLMRLFFFDLKFWINMILLAVGAMAFGTSIYFQASTELGPKKASSFIFTVPISAMLFAIIILNEPLFITTIIGGSLGIIAVYLIND